MLVTQRSEFASVIQRHGSQVGELLAMMRERTKTTSVGNKTAGRNTPGSV